jgi:hypothetical protein
VRDLTDTTYNPERAPRVNHFAGTDRVVEHVEKCWCPSFTSTDLTGKPRSASRTRDKASTAPPVRVPG